MSKIRQLVSTVTGTATGVAPGSAVSGNSVFMGGTSMKVSNLSAAIDATVLTNTITFTARWQVSSDASTWRTVANGPQNAAGVALLTGVTPQSAKTASVMLPAPDAIAGWKYARAQLVVGVVTGTTNETYSIGYSYRQFSQGELAR